LDIQTIEDVEVIRKLLPITGIPDNPAVCWLSVFVEVWSHLSMQSSLIRPDSEMCATRLAGK
jgi:hypothetical protein